MIYALLGAAFAVAGADKLAGDDRYETMFDELGWSEEGRMAQAATEVAGGVLVGFRKTRRLGAVMLAGTSAMMLASELQHNRGKLAGPRGLLLAASLLALVAPGRR